MTSRPSTAGRLATIALALFALLALTLGAYVGGYLWLGFRSITGGFGPGVTTSQVRAFSNEWLVTIYRPAACVESLISGTEIVPVCWPDLWDQDHDHAEEDAEPSEETSKPDDVELFH